MGSDIEQLPVLLLAEVLCYVHVQGRTAVQILHIVLSVELELVDHRKLVILRIVEVRAVHIVLRRYEETVLLVPFVVLSG